jgi:hypothetical protein
MAEEPEIGGREPIVLAGVRQIAYGLALVMAGFLVVMLAQSIWAILFRADVDYLFSPFDFWIREAPLWTPTDAYVSGYLEGLISLSVVLWLIGYAIRRATKSMSSGRPA